MCCLLFLGPVVQADTKAEKNFKKLADEILTDLYKFYPVRSTSMGIHDYDGKFTDYSKSNVSSHYSKFKTYVTRLHKYRSVKLPLEMKIDMRALRSNCETALLDLGKIAYHKNNPSLYIDEAIEGIYLLMIADHLPLDQRVNSILGRMNNLPKYLEQGQENLKKVPPVWLTYSREHINDAIDLYTGVVADLQEKLPTRQEEIKKAGNNALAALEQFKSFLRGLTPGEPGSFAIGIEYFDYILQHKHLLGYNNDSLLNIGEYYVSILKEEYDEKQNAMNTNRIESGIFVPPSFCAADVLEYYRWELDNIRQFIIDRDLLTIPETVPSCKVVETPSFMGATITSFAYQWAPPFDSLGESVFFIKPVPELASDSLRLKYYRNIIKRDLREVMTHEVWPGHHLQMELARNQPSAARLWQVDNVFCEGWAFYCEEMIYKAGLYADQPEIEIKFLGAQLLRAARAVIDVKLHTGRFSYQDAVDYLVDLMGGGREYFEKEVMRYTMTPGQPMSYLAGKLAILELREEVKAREGDDFSLKDFHDRLLSVGSVSPALVGMKILQ